MFARPGMGKTSAMLDLVCYRMKKGQVRKTLILAPATVIRDTWPREVEKFKQFRHLRLAVCHGKDKDKLIRDPNYDVYLVSVDGLRWLNGLDDIKLLKQFDMLICDESSKFKNHGTQRFKILKQWIGFFKYRYVLTGTPAPKSLENLWTQIYILDKGETLGRFITYFRNKYFYARQINNAGVNVYTPIPGAQEAITKNLSKFCTFLDDEDYLNLPPLNYSTYTVEGDAKFYKVYKAVEEDFIHNLQNGLINSRNAGTSVGLLQQVCNGAAYLSEDTGFSIDKKYKDKFKKVRDWEEIHNLKIDRLKELMDELEGKPTLIFYRFKHDKARLQHHLKSYGVEFFDVKNTEDIVRRWNRGEINYLATNPGPISHGLNMQDAGPSGQIWYSPTWDFEEFYQTVKRLHRGGQKYPVFIYAILMKDTIDEAIYNACLNKGKKEKSFLVELNEWAKKKRSG